MSISERNAENGHQSADIIVVGAGIVGTACVAALTHTARQPGPCRVFWVAPPAPEAPAGADTGPHSFDVRVVALTEASRQLLDNLGVWPAVTAARACPYTHMHVWDGEGSAAIDFDSAELRTPALGHIVENRVLTRALTGVLPQGEPLVRFTQKVASLQRGCSGQVTGVVLEDGTALNAPLVIAADGARSPLRAMAELPVREWSYGQKAIIATVQTENPHQHTAWQCFMATGPLAFLPLSDGTTGPQHYSSIVWSADTPFADKLMAEADSDFAHTLARAFEQRLGAVTAVGKRYAIALEQRHARRYFAPGLVLVGDAAHSIHPLAGQGVNLGLLDVACLLDELQRATRRGLTFGDTAALKRYQRQRMTHNLTMMAAMESFKRSFGARRPEIVWARNRALSLAAGLPLVKNALARYAMGQTKVST